MTRRRVRTISSLNHDEERRVTVARRSTQLRIVRALRNYELAEQVVWDLFVATVTPY